MSFGVSRRVIQSDFWDFCCFYFFFQARMWCILPNMQCYVSSRHTRETSQFARSECLSSYCLHTREDCRTHTGRYVNKSWLYILLDILGSHNLWWPVFLRKNLRSCKAGVNKAQSVFKCGKKCDFTLIVQKSQWHRIVTQQKYPIVLNKQTS